MYRQNHFKIVVNNKTVLQLILHQLSINPDIFHVIDNCADIFYIKHLDKDINSRHLEKVPFTMHTTKNCSLELRFLFLFPKHFLTQTKTQFTNPLALLSPFSGKGGQHEH